ncbi:regulatory protein RecX [Marinomonas sp.]
MTPPTLSVFDQALALLSHREHTKKELKQKLQQRGYQAPEIDDICLRLLDMNYLNDERFCEIFVRSRSQKPLGPQRILQELIQRGIKTEQAKQAIQNCEADWFELAKQLKDRRFGESRFQDYKEKAKQMRYLQYRGFDFDQINYALTASAED